jgi:hypothetical protein
MTPATLGGCRYLLVVDDATRFIWVVLLATKDAAADTIKQVQAAKESGRKLRVLRTNNG